jgi:hypothetical protein
MWNGEWKINSAENSDIIGGYLGDRVDWHTQEYCQNDTE